MPGSSPHTLVMKFGGTSVGTPEAIAQTAQIIQRQRALTPRLIVVTSALSGVTDLLLNSAAEAAHGKTDIYNQAVQTLRNKHEAVLRALIQDRARQEEARGAITLLDPRFCQSVPGHRRAGRSHPARPGRGGLAGRAHGRAPAGRRAGQLSCRCPIRRIHPPDRHG